MKLICSFLFSLVLSITSFAQIPATSSAPPYSLPIGSRAALTVYALQQVRVATLFVHGDGLREQYLSNGRHYVPGPDGAVDVRRMLGLFDQMSFTASVEDPKLPITTVASLSDADGSTLFSGQTDNYAQGVKGGGYKMVAPPLVDLRFVAEAVRISLPGVISAQARVRTAQGAVIGTVALGIDKGNAFYFPSRYAGIYGEIELVTSVAGTATPLTYSLRDEGRQIFVEPVVVTAPVVMSDVMIAPTDAAYYQYVVPQGRTNAPPVQYTATKQVSLALVGVSPDGEAAQIAWVHKSGEPMDQWRRVTLLPNAYAEPIPLDPGTYFLIFEFAGFDAPHVSAPDPFINAKS